MTAVSRLSCVELLYYKKLSLWRVYGSSILIWNMERELEAIY